MARIAALFLLATAPGLSAQVLDLDLGDPAAARTLADHRIPARGDFAVELTVRGHHTGEQTRVLLGTGTKLDAAPGWTLCADRSGSWSWHLRGKGTLEYAPTPERQPLYDEREHTLAFSVVRAREEARLFFDGEPVAVYALNGVGFAGGTGLVLGPGMVPGRGQRLRIWHDVGPYGPQPAKVETPRRLRVMAWNIWHGGRENGAALGVRQVIEVIRASRADIVCMQETYGSGPQIADALGYHFYLRSSNLSVHSRFPIGATYDLFEPFHFGGAMVHAGALRLRVHSLWIHHLPSLKEALAAPDCTPEKLVAGEWRTRAKEMQAILGELHPALAGAEVEPVLVAGDFNSPSHLDWVASTRSRAFHRGHVVAWPVSRLCVDAGLCDGFRAVHPDPAAVAGITWSPRFGDTQRIDYVYHKGARLRPVAAEVIRGHPQRFPSDHAAVVVEYEVAPR